MAKKPKPSPHHLGTRWIRAALQVNPFAYSGAGAPSSKFIDEPAYNTALLDRCEAEDIELIAVTDHWSIDGSQQLIADAEARGIVALPGFEANASEGIHLLVIFTEGTQPSVINAAIGVCGGTPGKIGKVGNAYEVILAKMAELGALVIPAHANVAKSGLLTSRTGESLVSKVLDKNLLAIGISPSAVDGTDQQAIFKNTAPYKREHRLTKIHADDISHPDTLGVAGGTTWFKMSKPCAASLKHALLTPSTRVRLEDPTVVPRAVIREVSWQGGFLDGVTVKFSDDLTNLIGGRGTGKSTVIESLRYVLDVAPLGPTAKIDHASIIKDVLGSGATVSLVVDAVEPSPGRYTIQRTVYGPPLVLDPSDSPTDLMPEDVVGPVDIYGQHELAELAQEPERVLEMISRFSTPSQAEEDRNEILERLSKNRNAIAKAESALAKLEEEVSDIPRLQAQVDRFKDSEAETRLTELQRLRQDEGVFKSARARIDEVQSLIDDLGIDDLVESLKADLDLIDGSAHEDQLKKAQKAVTDLAKVIESAGGAIDTAIEKATQEVDDAKTAWTAASSTKKTEHDEVMRALKEEGIDPDKYLTVTTNLQQLKTKAKGIPGAKKLVSDAVAARKSLMSELLMNQAQLNKNRAAMLSVVNKSTSKVIRVQSTQSPDRSNITSLINAKIPNQKTQIVAAVEEADFSVAAFVVAVRSGEKKLEEEFKIKGAQAQALISAGEPFLRELEERQVNQAVDVSLDTSVGDGAVNWKKLSQLSKGQRATALLLLLLGASSSLLIIDQPEDDLDNRFVFREIVKKLRALKGKRQVIASTHNANIPVLGDAELIIALEGDGSSAWITADGEGSLDNEVLLGMVEDLLEGGIDAFKDRQHIYGF